MSTFAQLKSQIADDLARDDLTTQIEEAVLAAIVDHERTRFYFNERRAAPAFTTVADQELYTASDDADIATIAHIDSLVMILNGSRRKLFVQTEQWMDEMSGLGTGAPTHYSYIAKRIRLYPIPDAAYQVYMTGQIRLATLSAGGDTNAWTEDAKELIRVAATEKIYRQIVHDFPRADQMMQQVAYQKMLLTSETTVRGGPMRVRATTF